MTHSLHRQGTPENLSNDFVVFAIAAQGINAEEAAPRFDRFAETVLRHNPVSFGDMRTGNYFATPLENIRSSFRGNSIVHAVFNDEETVTAVLKELREADLGISIVVSGLFAPVHQACRRAGTQVHTIEHSLGIWGRTERLPAPGVLQLTTMCGHGMIAFSLVEYLLGEIEKGYRTSKDAARELAAQCQCGIFNPVRAEGILQAMLKK
ncbi:MAG: hypothetical protein M1553_04035 [Firmicutes bacterium]|nr:hypothetical protein [Bacillota bacterium]